MQAAPRLSALNSERRLRLRRLIAAEAWTDAALALIDIALPRWKLVRLAFDDGAWRCALSRHWQLPEWLDDAVEASHEVLPLAILAAFLAARDADLAAADETRRAVPTCRPAQGSLHTLACDNFS